VLRMPSAAKTAPTVAATIFAVPCISGPPLR
jgi:hypothetical protein